MDEEYEIKQASIPALAALLAKHGVIAKTRKIRSGYKMLSRYQDEMVEILENMGVPADNIHEIVWDLLAGC